MVAWAVLLVGLILLILLWPLQFRVHYRYWSPPRRLDVSLWLFSGLVRITWNTDRDRLFLTFFHPAISVPLPRRQAKVKQSGGKGHCQRGGYLQVIGLGRKLWENREVAEVIVERFSRIIARTRMEIEELKLEVGTGDAAETGILVGLIWSFLGATNQVFSRNQRTALLSPSTSIKPDFQQRRFRLQFTGILQVRPGHIIIELLPIVAVLFKWRGPKIPKEANSVA